MMDPKVEKQLKDDARRQGFLDTHGPRLLEDAGDESKGRMKFVLVVFTTIGMGTASNFCCHDHETQALARCVAERMITDLEKALKKEAGRGHEGEGHRTEGPIDPGAAGGSESTH